MYLRTLVTMTSEAAQQPTVHPNADPTLDQSANP